MAVEPPEAAKNGETNQAIEPPPPAARPPLDDQAAPIALTATPVAVESPDIGAPALGPHALGANPLSVGVPELGAPAASEDVKEAAAPGDDYVATVIPAPPPRRLEDDATYQIVQLYLDRRRRSIAATTQQSPAPPLALQTGAALSGTGGIQADATPVPGPSALHQEVLRRLTSVEEAVAALTLIRTELRAGIGHNQPPEPIDAFPIESDERRTIDAVAVLLRALPAAPPTPPVEAQDAADKIALIGGKGAAYVAKQGDNFVSEVVKVAAHGVVPVMVGGGLLYAVYLLAERLMDLADAIQAWAEVLSLPH